MTYMGMPTSLGSQLQDLYNIGGGNNNQTPAKMQPGWTPTDIMLSLLTSGGWAAGKGLGDAVGPNAYAVGAEANVLGGKDPAPLINQDGTQIAPNKGDMSNPNQLNGSNLPGGIDVINSSTAEPGLAGFFGATDTYPLFTASPLTNPNFAPDRSAIGSALGGVQGRSAPVMNGATINARPQAQVRGQQMQLGQLLSAAANGNGPTAADKLLQEGSQRNMANSLALALGARGGDRAGALKGAQMQQALTGQDTALQAGQLRAQEMQNAQGQLGGVLSGIRAGDQQLATDQAGLDQQAAATNLGAALQTMGLNDAQIARLLGMQTSLDSDNFNSGVQQQQFGIGSLAQQVAGAHGVAIQNAAINNQTAGQGLQALGSLLALIPK